MLRAVVIRGGNNAPNARSLQVDAFREATGVSRHGFRFSNLQAIADSTEVFLLGFIEIDGLNQFARLI